MESKILDNKEISEKYTSTNGSKRTRVHTVRAMDNNGSKFINYRCGRQSVNISKNAFEEIQKLKLDWTNDNKQTDDKTQETLLEHIQQLQKQINKLKGN